MPSRVGPWKLRISSPWRAKPRVSARRRASQTAAAYKVLKDIGLAAICLLAIIGFFYWRPFAAPDPKNQPAVGLPASFLEVYPLEKVLAAVSLPAFQEPKPLTMNELVGQVTLVFFWGPWNEPSVDALRRLASVLPILSRKDFRFVAVACPPPPNLEMPLDFLSWTEATWKDCQVPVLCYLDLQGTSQTRLAILNQKHPTQLERPSVILPATVLIDKEGIIDAVWEGWIPNREQDISHELDRLLGLPPPSPRESPHATSTRPDEANIPSH